MIYAIEYLPNPQMAKVHFDMKLPAIASWFVNPKDETKEANALKAKLLAIKGITEVHSRDYCITITRAGVFKWPELIDQVVGVIVEHYQATNLLQVEAFE